MAWDKKVKDEEDPVDQFKPTTELIEDNDPDLVEVKDNESFDGEPGFDISAFRDTGDSKEIFTVYGAKNDGKTTCAYGIPFEGDKVAVLSFDKKSNRPVSAPYIKKANLTIEVFNANLNQDKTDKKILESAIKVYGDILNIIRYIGNEFDPDWIMFDGTEQMSNIMELVMRANNKIKPEGGIANLSLWKQRRRYIDDIHHKSVEIAKKGVIYTMYPQKDDIIEEGTTVLKKDVPKWIGSVMEETDVVIHVKSKFEGGKKNFFAHVEGSKLPEIYPEDIFDITNKRFRDALPKK